MEPARVLTFSDDLPAEALSWLASNDAAAWLVDIAGGRIPAANAAGSALLGLDGVRPVPLLDASMPALARLRALAREPTASGTAPERLVFWGPHGVLRVPCRVRILRDGLQVLAAVIALDNAGPKRSADDEARLQEIAREIREGHTTRVQPTQRDPSPNVDAAAAPSSDAPAAGDASAGPTAFPLRASLAHELKTPVSAISAAAEIMRDERFGPLGDPRYVGYARDIHGSAQHVLGLIDRMLEEGHAEAGPLHGDLDFTEIDTGTTLEATVSQLVPLAERAGIALALELAPRLPHVIADATSLRQIVFNLVTNALKFTDRGGRISVSAHCGGDGTLSIAVSDTGAGIAADEIERLLARDGPVGARRGREAANGPGLGLGLPLVQALASANGAEIIIESTPGKGTSAWVVFAKARVVPV